jgi:hypothetical protein
LADKNHSAINSRRKNLVHFIILIQPRRCNDRDGSTTGFRELVFSSTKMEFFLPFLFQYLAPTPSQNPFYQLLQQYEFYPLLFQFGIIGIAIT